MQMFTVPQGFMVEDILDKVKRRIKKAYFCSTRH